MNFFNSIPLSQIPFPVIVADKTDTILASNPAAKTLLGMPAKTKGYCLNQLFDGYTSSHAISAEALKSGEMGNVITMCKSDILERSVLDDNSIGGEVNEFDSGAFDANNEQFEVIVVKVQHLFVLFFKTFLSTKISAKSTLENDQKVNLNKEQVESSISKQSELMKSIETDVDTQLSSLEVTYRQIAKDFDDVLGTAVGAIKLMEMRAGEKKTKNSVANIERLKQVVSQGKTLTKELTNKIPSTDTYAESFCPDKIIRKNIEILRRVCDSRISLVIASEHRNIMIKFPMSEFINILKGMVENASEAIEGKLEQDPNFRGKIEISTFEREDGKCAVVISDNGGGIKVEDASILFTPLYSTKVLNNSVDKLLEPLKLTPSHSSHKIKGLSLSLVYRALKRHEADIGVNMLNTEGGATFTLSFHSVHVNSIESVKGTMSQANVQGKEKQFA